MDFIEISKILDPFTDISQTNNNWNYFIEYHMKPIYHNVININKTPSFNAMKFVVNIHDYMISELKFKYRKGKWNICQILSQLDHSKYNCSSLTTLILLICN